MDPEAELKKAPDSSAAATTAGAAVHAASMHRISLGPVSPSDAPAAGERLAAANGIIMLNRHSRALSEPQLKFGTDGPHAGFLCTASGSSSPGLPTVQSVSGENEPAVEAADVELGKTPPQCPFP